MDIQKAEAVVGNFEVDRPEVDKAAVDIEAGKVVGDMAVDTVEALEP